jgi:hypothetical protein
MHPRSPEDISETETFIDQSIADLKNGNNLELVILKKESQEFLGCAGLHGLSASIQS